MEKFPYKPEVYAALHKATQIMDRPTKYFVLGLEMDNPPVWNDLASVAHDFGTVACVYAVRACLGLTSKAKQQALQRMGRQLETLAEQNIHVKRD